MTEDLTGDLDLLGDWLDAKGYTEEAGLCTRVMDHMHKQAARIAQLEAALEEQHRQYLKLELKNRAVEYFAEQFSKEKAEYYRHILRLQAALKPFADRADHHLEGAHWMDACFTVDECLAARAALVGKDEQNDG